MKRSEFIPYHDLYQAVQSMAERIPAGVLERIGSVEYVEITSHDLTAIIDACKAVKPVDITPNPRSPRKVN